MKRVLIVLISIFSIVGCMDKESFNVESPIAESSETFVSPMEIALGNSQTKAFDEELKWTWEETDEIYGYQVAGESAVNTLTFVEDNRFGTEVFTHSTQDPATFHFIYAGDASVDQTASGNRGIKQNSQQSGKWTPVLVGSAENQTLAQVMNDGAEIDMEHLSAALEIRLWNEGVDKENLTDADKKNILYAELISDTEYFLLDVVPTYNQDGTVSYTPRERGQDEEVGAYVRTENVNGPVVVFNIAPHTENYAAGDLRLGIVDQKGDRYVLNVPPLNFFAGKRTILNVEWKTDTSAELPAGGTFNEQVGGRYGFTHIKFITSSITTSTDVLAKGIYMVKNGGILEIHTAARQFVANSDCSEMFRAYDGWYGQIDYVYISNAFAQVETIDFGENFNTENVEDMRSMFYNCFRLTSLDVSNFNTQNVWNMSNMFSSCSALTSLNVSNFNTQNVRYMNYMFSDCSGLTSLDLSSFSFSHEPNIDNIFYNTGNKAGNKPISIYVTTAGKKYIERKSSGINNSYATLVVQ